MTQILTMVDHTQKQTIQSLYPSPINTPIKDREAFKLFYNLFLFWCTSEGLNVLQSTDDFNAIIKTPKL